MNCPVNLPELGNKNDNFGHSNVRVKSALTIALLSSSNVIFEGMPDGVSIDMVKEFDKLIWLINFLTKPFVGLFKPVPRIASIIISLLSI